MGDYNAVYVSSDEGGDVLALAWFALSLPAISFSGGPIGIVLIIHSSHTTKNKNQSNQENNAFSSSKLHFKQQKGMPPKQPGDTRNFVF